MDTLFTATRFTGKAAFGPLPSCGDSLLDGVLARLPQRPDGTLREVRFSAPDDAKLDAFARALGRPLALDEDAFLIEASERTAHVYARNARGFLYGAYSLLQQSQDCGELNTGLAYAEPLCPFRGLKVYLPSPGDLNSFYHTVDMLCYYRHNTIILEVGGAMAYERHPEIAEAWVRYCEDMGRYPDRANEVQTMFGWDKNSIHFENGGGQVLPQRTVRELVRYCKERGLDVIPEVPCLSHADYLLNPHPELAERAEDPYPDCYCPSNPASYELLFDVLEEVVEVFEPKTVHIGHDEYYSIGLCPLCRKKDAAELFAADVNKIAGFLRKRGIRTMMWAEKMLNAIGRDGECYGGSEKRKRHEDGSVEITRPATWRSIDLIDKDVIAMHWYWGVRERFDEDFHRAGFQMVYGNLDSHRFLDWKRRLAAGALGGTCSHWSSLESDTLQRNCAYLSLVYSALLFWDAGFEDGQYERALTMCFGELFHYRNRELMKRPRLEIVHTSTLKRPYAYISSLPLQNAKDTIGCHRVRYEGGEALEIPIVYGLNISGCRVDWQRRYGVGADIMSADTESYMTDLSLLSVSYTTLPMRKEGYTVYKLMVENPHPDRRILSVDVLPAQGLEPGDIVLCSFEAKD